MVKGTLTYLKFNLMKEKLIKMFGESLPSIEKCSIKAEDIFHAQDTSWNHYEKLYGNDFIDDEECQQQETYLTSYTQRYLIDDFSHVNKNNAGIQPTTYTVDRNNTQTLLETTVHTPRKR